jgi:hypothetical protein
MEAPSLTHMPQVPLLLSLATFFGTSNDFLQNKLCFFNWNNWEANTYLGVIYHILTTLWHCMTPTRTYKRCQQSQNLTRYNIYHGGKIDPFIFDIWKYMNIKPMFYKHVIQLHCHGISRCACNFKNPLVTWQGSHFSFKKWKIRTNVLTVPLDIQRSKYTMHVLHDWRVWEINISFVYLVIIGKSLFLNFYPNMKFNQGFYLTINLLKK